MMGARTRLRLPDAGSAIALLRILLGMSIAAPVMLFVLLAWIEYRNVVEAGRREMLRVSDVAREHAEKAFEGQNQVIERINDLLRNIDRDTIREQELHLHDAMSHIIAHLSQVQEVAVVDSSGAPLVSATGFPVPTSNLRNTDYFQAVMGSGEPFIGRVQTTPLSRAPVFGLAGPWWNRDGTLNGLVAVAAAPSLFEDFYAALAREINRQDGTIVTLVRSDGQLLVRYPPLLVPAEQIPRSMNFLSAMREAPEYGTYLARSVVGANPIYRLYVYRKIAGYPLYVIAGVSWDELLRAWYPRLAAHLAFGIPATAALFLITRLALRRVRLEKEARARAEAEIDRRRRAEDVLLRAQRLEAVGQLTGGVAHDFNNLLTIISGNAEMIVRRSGDPVVDRLANAIALAARRGGDITQKLLAFSGRQIVRPENVDLNRRLEEFKPLLDRAASEAVTMALHLDPKLGLVRLDPGQFEAAILNLVGNARDAMPQGGRITIRTRALGLAEAAALDLPPAPHAQIVVSDTGQGMDEATAARAFEPFFTTKGVGRGTGLGLSQVYGFARQAGGTARIATSSGRGTTVTLILPCIEARATVTPVAAEAPPHFSTGEVVLVVEDEPALRETAVDCLQGAGYRVLTAQDGPAALGVLRSGVRVDILFSDILMPGGMDGVQLAHKVRELRPDLPMLMTSGASPDGTDALPPNIPMLMKPYECGELIRQLGRTLERQGQVLEERH